jgi:hypothetical protein
MVRVKKHKNETHQFLKKAGDISNQKTKSNLNSKKSNDKKNVPILKTVSSHYIDYPDSQIAFKKPKKVKKYQSQYSIFPKVIISQPLDSIQGFSQEEFFIRNQYRRANTNTWLSLGLLLSTVVTGIGLLFAIILSIKAIRIYRKYRNPGVPEYYGLAWGVLIASIFLVLFLIVLLVGIFGGGII